MGQDIARVPEGTRLVFLHLPKTAGTSLRAALARHFRPEEVVQVDSLAEWGEALADPGRYRFWAGHMPFSLVALIPPPVFVVTLLRDPVARILSLYTFWRRHADPSRPHLRAAMEGDLEAFLASSEPAVRNGTDNHMARLLHGRAPVAEAEGWPLVAQPEDAARRMSDAELLEGARRNLLRCGAVGIADDVGGLYRRIAAAFGFTPGAEPPRLNTRESGAEVLRPAGAPPVVTPAAAAALDRLTRLDRPLFALARRLAEAGPRPEDGAPAAAEGADAAWSVSAAELVEALHRGLRGRPPGPRERWVQIAALVSGQISPAELVRRLAARAGRPGAAGAEG